MAARALASDHINGGATPGPGRSYALPLKNWDLAKESSLTWRWDLPVKF